MGKARDPKREEAEVVGGCVGGGPFSPGAGRALRTGGTPAPKREAEGVPRGAGSWAEGWELLLQWRCHVFHWVRIRMQMIQQHHV
jgi:hypothetical protein